MCSLPSAAICDELIDISATALLLQVGHSEPAVSIVKSVRRDPRLAGIMIGAPAGQPEFTEWAKLLADEGAATHSCAICPSASARTVRASSQPCVSGWQKRPPS